MSGVLPGARSSVPQLPVRPSRRPLRLIAGVLVALVLLSVWSVDVAWDRLGELPAQLWHYLTLMFASPNWDKLGDALWQTWRSVQMAWVGTVLGVIVAFPLSFLAARGVGPAPVRGGLRFLFALIRAVPDIIILSVTGLTPLTGALALAIGSVGTLGKWGFEALERVPGGAAEATRAAGGSPTQVMRWGLWPEVAPEFYSFWLYRFEINVRASAVLGLIGVGGIGDMLTSYTQYREWSTVGMLLIVVVVVTVALDVLSGAVRRRIMDGGAHGRR